MKKLIAIALVAYFGWQGFTEYRAKRLGHTDAATATSVIANEAALARSTSPDPVVSDNFRCDGRIYCSQMTSCAEATFFLRSCPGVKMDGNNDGVPCEKQWCN